MHCSTWLDDDDAILAVRGVPTATRHCVTPVCMNELSDVFDSNHTLV